MMRFRCLLSLLLLVPLVLTGCDRSADSQTQTGSDTPQPGTSAAGEAGQVPETVTSPVDGGDLVAKEMDWDELIPEDWRPELLMEEFNADDISDEDPRAQELLDKLMELWSKAPVVQALEGQRVKLPGFVVPLEMDAERIDQFLLVPYYGACIHVPPPPANQTVHVVMREGTAFPGHLFDTVWVTGTIRVERLSSQLGEAGYRMENASVVPYQ